MAKVKHIQVNTLPNTLEANAIYFVRDTGEIWQTDSNGVGIRFSGGSVGYVNLKPELKGTAQISNSANIDIDFSESAAFQIDGLQQDTNINFINLQENKQVKLIVKGNVAITFTSENNETIISDNLSYNATDWNIIVAEVTKIAGVLQINLLSLQ